ncbi:MAG TPA: polysaccharide biosynthesis/export family protein [Tepidisphaeraceae bacterium]|nr:polysaccharide biosynthesis/export family protein [Tepidisphaeraceae bacterium]
MRSIATAAALAVAAVMTGGCETKSFLDPGEMGRYEKGPALQKPILNSLSSFDRSIDDPNDEFVNATDVRPEDLQVVSHDYVIGKNDVVNVSVTDLVGPGVETQKITRVSESGRISLPLIGQVQAEGLTEAQLEQAIVDAYRNANLIQNAQVSVTVTEPRGRTFSVLGAVNNPGQYGIYQSDFRLLDALVTAHDVMQSVDTLYVIRQLDEEPGNVKGPATTPPPPTGGGAGTGTGTGTDTLAPKSPDILAPISRAHFGGTNVALLQTTGNAGTAGDHQLVLPNGQAPASTETTPPPPVDTGAGALAPTPGAGGAGGAGGASTPAPAPATSFQFVQPKAPSETRVIRIPLNALKNGDLRYNIVIRPRDLVLAPTPVIGEYYMGGHVSRVGVYSLTARKITLKEAIVSAGMLDGLSIPQRTDIIRRLGPDREVFARINLDAIFGGTQPDIYLKPYDQIMVGTNLIAPFLAAIRGGFRLTYGFGFLYDRNYAPQQSIGG